MKAKVMTIGPELARQMLEKNNGNRPVSKRAVRRYAHDMSTGKWTLNGEPIILDHSGRLLDGQHRLLAVIESGVTIDALVVTGADPSVFNTIDAGNTRSGSDILSIKGYTCTKVLAAIVRTAYIIENGGLADTAGYRLPGSKAERIDYVHLVEHYEEAQTAASFIQTKYSSCLMLRPSAFSGAMYVLFGKQDRRIRDLFFEAITDLESPYATIRPIARLRKSYERIAVVKNMKLSEKYRFDHWDKAFREFKRMMREQQKQPAFPVLNARQPTSQPR